MDTKNIKNIAVIGAGAAGLVAIKRLTETCRNFTCSCFELYDKVGGLWVYNDKTGEDEYGIPIYTSLYQNLTTNLPKEIMILTDFPYEKLKDNRSYITSDEVLQYLEDYATHFNLRKYIKFRHFVKNVAPTSEEKWRIEVLDLENQKEHTYYYDAVLVCVGKFSSPIIPDIPNIENFSGSVLHSHDYRKPATFQDQTVLIIGGKLSALDISFQVSTAARKIYLSHHNDMIRNVQFPNNMESKPDVQEIQDGNVVFVDGSKVFVDAILFCTGYAYSHPFLDEKCKITTETFLVKPLYKQFLNIEHPTMAIIGIPKQCPGFSFFDLQISCFLNILEGKVALPSKSEMHAELDEDIIERRKITGDDKNYHLLMKQAVDYCADVAQWGKVPPVKPVIFKMCFTSARKAMETHPHFKKDVYTVINDQDFILKELDYPFLDAKYKITTETFIVKPLYKQFINIEHPTMAIIGIPKQGPGYSIFDLQVKNELLDAHIIELIILKGKIALPSRKEMHAELNKDIIERRKKNGDDKYYHVLLQRGIDYCADVAEWGKVPPIKPVMFKMCRTSARKSMGNHPNFKKDVYTVINDEDFILKEVE